MKTIRTWRRFVVWNHHKPPYQPSHEHMSNTQYRQKSVRQALNTFYPCPPQGNHSRRLDGLAALINGIVASKSCRLSACASECSGDSKTASRTRNLERVVANKWIDTDTYYLPCILRLLETALERARRLNEPLSIIIDSTKSGSCTTWMVSLLWGKRSIPLCWRVLKQKKGHAPQELPCELLEEVRRLLPDDVKVVILGDGEFDTCAFQAAIAQAGWGYVLRSAKNLTLGHDGEVFRFDSLCPGRGETTFWLESVSITQKHFTNDINALVWRGKGYKDPLYLLTNLDNAPDACDAYRKRFLMETLFSDIKSRGFSVHKTRLKDPTKIHRLLIAVALAYIWVLWMGNLAQNDPYYRTRLHRSDRTDWSCFRFGIELLHEWQRTDMSKLRVCFILDS